MNALKLNYKPSFDRFDFILNYLKNMNFVCKRIALELNWFQRFGFVICTQSDWFLELSSQEA